jgi:hypothetical protein
MAAATPTDGTRVKPVGGADPDPAPAPAAGRDAVGLAVGGAAAGEGPPLLAVRGNEEAAGTLGLAGRGFDGTNGLSSASSLSDALRESPSPGSLSLKSEYSIKSEYSLTKKKKKN